MRHNQKHTALFIDLLNRWDPEQDTLDAVTASLREHLQCRAAALYLLDNRGERQVFVVNSLSLNDSESVSDTDQQAVWGHHDVERQMDEPFPIKVEKSFFSEIKIWPKQTPRFVSVPLAIGEQTNALLMLELVHERRAKQVAQAASAVAPLLARITQADVLRRALQQDLQAKQRERSAEGFALRSTLSVEYLSKVLIAQCVRSIGYSGGLYAKRVGAEAQGFTFDFGWKVPETLQDRSQNLNGRLFVIDKVGDTALVSASEASALVEFGIASVLAVPLGSDTARPAGVLALWANSKPPRQRGDALALLQAYARQLQLVLEQQSRFQGFRKAYEKTLQAAIDAMELSRSSLRGHHARVCEIALGIYDKFLKSGQNLEEAMDTHVSPSRTALMFAATFHDVGLLGGEDAVVTTALEFEHPEIGASMVMPLPNGEAVARVIREHHESYDGFGFPKGLKENEISDAGYALACAEFVVERTTASPVAPAASLQETAQIVEKESSVRFSCGIAHAASSLLRLWSEAPFSGGDCVLRKRCPDDVCQTCKAARSSRPCWTLPIEARSCERHGDSSCEECFIWRTWGTQEQET